ncbi:S46 family peptidase [Mediterranea massiliensis]|nr:MULTISPECIES: S46 family peptidase [Mediterranea]MCL1606980.1 S46 family peptidase [Mediterranea sp. ET5]MDM8121744.1 S46 family peptidase [Mediterranea massiliensis]MDM8197491.1 S46 family peptidase [Mediterranea massiliensis]
MFAPCAYADEGMWVLSMLSKRSQKQMKALGLKLNAKQLYNPDGPSFKDAIVSFGGFCSGVVVSPDGLVFTNHHCGYGSIQEHSAPDHDYLKNGFVARTYKEELPNPDLHVSFLIRTEDVTQRVKALLTDDMGLRRRQHVVDSVSRAIEKEAVAGNKLLRAEVASYYQGNEFYLSIYKDYKDVRLVYAPPSSLGKLGGDTDNWMWPRHTCDFSVFRIYAGPDNEPAEYSPENKPYQASAYAPVSLKGYEEGDFCMTMGYPGSTERYLSSFGVDERMKTSNAAMIQIRGIKQDIWTSYMEQDDATRIKYASKFASSSNYWKNSIGMNQSIADLGVIGQKQALENRLRTWIAQHPDMQKKYGTMLPALEQAYKSRFNASHARSFFYESLLGSAELPRFVINFLQLRVNDMTPEMKEQTLKTYEGKYADMDLNIDKEVFATMLKTYAEVVPAEKYHPSLYQTVAQKFGGDFKAYVDSLYAHTAFITLDGLKRFLANDTTFNLRQDPMTQVAVSLIQAYNGIADESGKDDEVVALNESKLCDALREMEIDRDFYPDANSTLRMSYGVVKSYDPLDAVHYNYYTTTQGILEKAKKGAQNSDYYIQPEVLKLFNGNYGRYGNKQGDMNTCFLSTNDITGGNSGSGMFNGKGELIGLAFDGNWEAMSGDIVFSPKLQRCIGVDIRYVLYVIENYGHADRLINELKLK